MSRVILETARLILREMIPQDIDFIATMMAHPDVNRFYERRFTREESEIWLDRQIERYRRDGTGLWLVVDRATSVPLGQVGLAMQDVEGKRLPEIGWLLDRPHWGQGYATEAGAAVRDAAFHQWGHRRLISLIRPVNHASQRVAQRLGMTDRRHVQFHGFEHCVFEISKPGGDQVNSQPALSEPSQSKGPIGVFDSGVGGLSVLREIRRELPAEDLLYVADTANAPYGDRDAAFIRERALAIVARLIEEHVKAVVVACNTATGLAVDALRERYDVPIVAIEPAVKPAALHTRSGVIGVLATTQTLASERFSKLVATHAAGVTVLTQPSPELVHRVEAGDLSSDETRMLVTRYVAPIVAGGADSIVLGCTHFPFLRSAIEAVAGPSVTIIDPAVAVAREVRRRLDAAGLLAPEGHRGTERVWTTGPPDETRDVVAALWGSAMDVSLVD